MKVIVISDSHNRNSNIRKVFEKEKPFDLVIHLGDSQGDEDYIAKMAGCDTAMVAGNCDFFNELPYEKIINLGRHRLLLSHGHRQDVAWSGTMFLKGTAVSHGCDYALFGHTHIPLMDGSDPQVTFLNPGSISLPRQEGRVPSYMVIDVDERGDLHPSLHYVG